MKVENGARHKPHRDVSKLFDRTPTEPAESTEKLSAPDTVRTAELARHRRSGTRSDVVGRGVQWVRPTDLIARQTGTLAGRGIDFQAELARHTRASTVARIRSLSDRARRMPPLSAFGRRSGTTAGPVRSGVGMS